MLIRWVRQKILQAVWRLLTSAISSDFDSGVDFLVRDWPRRNLTFQRYWASAWYKSGKTIPFDDHSRNNLLWIFSIFLHFQTCMSSRMETISFFASPRFELYLLDSIELWTIFSWFFVHVDLNNAIIWISESLFAIAQSCYLFFTAPKMSQYSVGIMGFLTGGLPMLTNLLLDPRKLTFRSKIQIIFQKWAPAVLFVIGFIIFAVNPSILQINGNFAEYFCSVICCIILSLHFILIV